MWGIPFFIFASCEPLRDLFIYDCLSLATYIRLSRKSIPSRYVSIIDISEFQSDKDVNEACFADKCIQ